MKILICTYGLAALLCWEMCGSLPPAAAADPPRLEPPAVMAPDSGPRGPGDQGSVIRRDGPPRELPADPAGPAPGPDYFFIPGQYVPSGEGFAWKPGFWTRVQLGWEWAPAGWVRLAEGWAYREGHWERAEADFAAPEPPRRHVVARPAPTSPFSPAASPPASSSIDPNPTTELAPLPDAGPAAPPPVVQVPPPPPPGLPGSDPNRDPRLMAPLIPYGLPITELDFPGVHIRVVPPAPWLVNGPMGYPRVVVPPVDVRVMRPLRGVRQRVRDLIDGALP